MNKLLLFFVGTILISETLSGQELSAGQTVKVVQKRAPTLSVGMQLAIPTGEFAEYYGGKPFGINAMLSIPLLSLPFEVGGGFAWNAMGGNSKNISVYDTEGNAQNGSLRVNGNAYTYQIHGRFRPLNGKFRPYGELFTGVRNFSIKSKLESDFGSEPTEERLNRSFTGIAGYAIGAKYQLVQGIFVEARFEKTAGSKATYIDPESVRIDPAGGSFSYNTTNSRTDQWALSLGLAFSF